MVAVLTRWLSRRGLGPQDLDEVCSDAILRLIQQVQRGKLDPQRPPGAWLRVVADHLAIDALRRRARAAGVPLDEDQHTSASDDDELAALLDRSAAATDVRRTLREAADAGDHEIVRVVVTWLGLASANGEAPSTRDVGARLGVSHMTVQRALRAFGERLTSSDVPRTVRRA